MDRDKKENNNLIIVLKNQSKFNVNLRILNYGTLMTYTG